MSRHITQSELESYLWGAATLLRGYIDAGEYKQYIFPLLFYKRLCDVYDGEVARALEESGGDKKYALFAENHRFQIPKEAHWNAVRAKVKETGKAIQNALRAIEKANPPYSIKKWKRKAWEKDPWGRNIYGTPPQGRADYAFFQHIISSLKEKTVEAYREFKDIVKDFAGKVDEINRIIQSG